jgi:hypothetical protein
MTNRTIEETNTDRMAQKNRANVTQPERAGTGPESQTYQQKTGRFVANDEANKKLGTPDTPATSAKPSASNPDKK